MEELTKERAHDLCVELWNDIIENGHTTKWHSYLIAKYDPECECFACEYYSAQGNGGCSACPLHDDYYCYDDGQPYGDWCDGIDRKENAIAIADLFID